MRHRPLENPQFKTEINQRTTRPNSARLLLRTAPLQRCDISVKRIWAAQKWLDKTGKRVSQHKRANHGFFGSTNAHFMSKYRKGKKKQTKKTPARIARGNFATRKIKVECGKAWGLCALGQKKVHWAYIYSKARTAGGFSRP